MAVEYSCSDGLKNGLSETFDGNHPCPLCKKVAEGVKNENKQPLQKTVLDPAKKCSLLCHESGSKSRTRPAGDMVWPDFSQIFSSLDTSPPTPPPEIRVRS